MQLAKQYEALWESGDSPPDVFAFLSERQGKLTEEQLQVLLIDQSRRWKCDAPLTVEDYLQRLPELGSDPEVKLQLAVGEFQARQDVETLPSIDDFTSRFSDIRDQLRSKLSELASQDNAQADLTETVEHIEQLEATKTFDEQVQPDRFGATATFGELTQWHRPKTTTSPNRDHATRGQTIGRYRLERVLGEGTFGRVYLAYDEELERQVAIKVPTEERLKRPEDAEMYLAEARTVASLDHPNIVPVYDMGRTDDGSVYLVSRFIAGQTLADCIRRARLSPDESATVLATVANALHHAHQLRLIHRDVKPGNILLEDPAATPYVADFGLAIREEDYLEERRLAGTPAYMSPEQVRGEGHRLDGRSDIFSLGVVLYEMLTGKKPFEGSTVHELFHEIISVDPRPPRELKNWIPVELERICLKSLSKQASDRYATAADLADDLSHWNESQPQETQELQIVPKGLRSFDAEDSDFFLDLLPGPRNRNGLPESIQFWKTRLEETDPDKTFSVGLMYGPSGCGKSSLVKAGLLPRLSRDVNAIYVEATPDETESRILRGLRKAVPNLPDDLGLAETFMWVRRSKERKVVIVLDQFEQWLQAHRGYHPSELTAALRQADGGHLQTIALVRDDFAMAAARFMDALDIAIEQGHNFDTVDLFDVEHARTVLVKFGQAFGKLAASGELNDDQEAFVRSVASGLARDGQVVSVRIALFAEMVKGKPWLPSTLDEVGGTEGIGVHFLEETFSSRTASPRHRLHERAAREVLKALLPEVGSDIKGRMRSRDELLDAIGYKQRSEEFNELLGILDGELRLITPAEREAGDAWRVKGEEDRVEPDAVGSSADSDGSHQPNAQQSPEVVEKEFSPLTPTSPTHHPPPASRHVPHTTFFQLTHDYLVPSLRDWLTRKQQETRRGRAEIKLAERAALWNEKPEARHLPSLLEWAGIRALTDENKWSQPERMMMRKAGWRIGLYSCLSSTAAALLVFIGLFIAGRVEERRNASYAKDLVAVLPSSNTAEVQGVIDQLAKYDQWATPLLQEVVADEDASPREKLHASLYLVKHESARVDPIYQQLLSASPDAVPVLVSFLSPHRAEIHNQLWGTVEKGSNSQRLRAIAALAAYDAASDLWKEECEVAATALLSVPASESDDWIELLIPISDLLTAPLERRFRDVGGQVSSHQRMIIAAALSTYLADDPKTLMSLILLADNDREFQPLLAALRNHNETVIPELQAFVRRSPPETIKPERKPGPQQKFKPSESDLFSKRQANAAVCLLELGELDSVLPLFEQTTDPSLRSFFIDRLPCLEPDPLVTRIQKVSDPAGRYAMLLALGQYEATNMSTRQRQLIVEQLLAIYRDDPNPEVHSAAGWALRNWQQGELVDAIDAEIRGVSRQEQRWFVNSQGQTFAVIHGPVELWRMYWEDVTNMNTRKEWRSISLSHDFAVATHEVTLEQFQKFRSDHQGDTSAAPQPNCPVNKLTWYDAAEYCNWLNEQEGIPQDQWCYKPNEQGEYAKGMQAAEDFQSRTGYRLPTDEEWEYTCRAGTTTKFSFGDSMELASHYGWYLDNSQSHMWPVGVKLPNGLGIFDMHGNALEWCHNLYLYQEGSSGQYRTDEEDRSLSGTAFNSGGMMPLGGSDIRTGMPPSLTSYERGFRLARTYLRTKDAAGQPDAALATNSNLQQITKFNDSKFQEMSGQLVEDDFSSSSIGPLWTTDTLVSGAEDAIEGASISQAEGVVTLISPAPKEDEIVDLQLVTRQAFTPTDFEASVDFLAPSGHAMAWIMARQPGSESAQVFGVYFNGSSEQYRIWRRTEDGEGRPQAALEYEMSPTSSARRNWHRLTLQYDAETEAIRATVDQHPLAFVADFQPTEIEICIGLKKVPRSGSEPAQIQFDNFRLRRATATAEREGQ